MNFLKEVQSVQRIVCFCISPRRWGKSSLVRESMKELVEEDKNINVCFLDAYKIHTEEEFYNKFASAVIVLASTRL